MQEYKLTNTTKEFITLLEERAISYDLKNPSLIYVWLPSDQDLFILAQDYEQRRNEQKTLSEQLREIWK